jgi:hypothetical protein
MNSQTLEWLLDSNEPWTQYHTRVDLLDQPPDTPEVLRDRSAMLANPGVLSIISEAKNWPGYALTRHNDAKHNLYKISTLADFGLQIQDPGISAVADAILAHQSPEGAFQSLVNIPRAFGGSGEDTWTWVSCDTPTLLYSLLAFGLHDHPAVQRAAAHLKGLVDENGWRCKAAPELGKFKGPGKRSDPCPITNVYALKALSMLPDRMDSPATRLGIEAILNHWALRKEVKYFLFGMGTDFHKIKYPFIWYDILHVVEALSRFPFVHSDPRFKNMLTMLVSQDDEGGRYTAGSMYMAWKGWSFANKKTPSPWLTFLVLRIQKRVDQPILFPLTHHTDA